MRKLKNFTIPEIVSQGDAVAVQIIFPFKLDSSRPCLREVPVYQCIADNQHVLIEALQARMQNCYQSLIDNSSRIVFNDGYTIEYKTEEGCYRSFNIPSWDAMKDALEALKTQSYKDWTVQMYEQVLKAVCLQELIHDIKDYDKVISYLINHIVCHE